MRVSRITGVAIGVVAALSAGVAAQRPASYTTFGKGCSGQAADPLIFATRLPFIGREFVTVVTRVRPNSVGVLIVGVSDRQWAGAALPLNLGFLGAGNCQLLVSWDVSLPFQTGSGTAQLRAVLPNQSALVGTSWFQQAVTSDPASNSAGWAMSNGAKAVVGSCPCGPPQAVHEDFLSDRMLDKQVSGGTWSGGQALAPRIGGRGVLGAFDIRAGRQDPRDPKRFVWSTDSQVVPGAFTPTGKDITVTGGVFEFTRFELSDGFTLTFMGSNPAQIRVAGQCVVAGTIEASAPRAPYFLGATASAPTATGGKGGLGNCGGAAGGQGGDSCDNKGARPQHNGRVGQVVRLPKGNGYAAQAAGTGGKGAPMFPANGVNTNYCALTGIFCGMMGVGGGGGGFVSRGGDGFPVVVNGVHQNPCRVTANSGSAPNTGGGTFDLGGLVNTNTGPNASLDFYAVGGSGGGGGGSHPLLTRRAPYDRWVPGSGGAGGGGVVLLRVGQDLLMRPTGVVEVHGGAGYVIDGVLRANEPGDGLFNVPTPGGGGSGGSILIQVAGSPSLAGLLDAAGGAGGKLDNTPTNQSGLLARANGGDGGDGYYRLETPSGPTVAQVGRGIPAATAKNVGVLADFELQGVSWSKFYTTGDPFAPTYLRYVIEATVGGARRVYSDDANWQDPNFSGRAAAGGPLRFEVQGGRVDLATGRVLSTGPWRDDVFSKVRPSLNDDGANGWRFRLTFDQTAAVVVVKKVSIWFQR